MATTPVSYFFFFNDTATTEIYTLSLHDALPISRLEGVVGRGEVPAGPLLPAERRHHPSRSESTRLNSSHSQISYAVFCLKKKKRNTIISRKLAMDIINP